ncbi:MAG: hypothetical protein KAU03_04690 [Candidatus Altiarchaeales archaeon]|nr:hypothetical protein [Candidatus Altiarchaeales archaeon]
MRTEVFSLLSVAVFILFCGCVGDTPETTTTTLPPVGGFELHEWGVLAGCPESDTFFVTGRPKQVLLVKQPVIYIHSRNKEPFNLTVTFNSGRPTDTYPQALVEESGVVGWRDVQVVDECDVAGGLKAAGFVPLEAIIGTLNDVDADCLDVSGVRERFLFYEGELEFKNKISVDYSFKLGRATFRNNGDHPAYNLILAASTRGGHAFSPEVYSASVSKLLLGQEETVDFVEETPDDEVLRNDLVTLGFTSREAGAFAGLWGQSFFYPGNRAGFANLVYRLSEEEYDEMISLEVAPQPEEIIRTLYVLVDVSAGGETSECSVDADCVRAQCCHPTSCVAIKDAPDCSGIGCTTVCAPGSMDCGQGHCVCVDGRCQVKWTPR